MFAKNKIIAVLSLVMLPAMTCQAAWMRQEGEVGVSAGFTISDNGEFFDRAGTRTRNLCGTGYDVPMQLEYGKSYYTTLFGSTSLAQYSCGGITGTTSGFTDVEVGMRRRVNLFTNDQVWEVAAIIPNTVDPNNAARMPKDLGIRLGYHSSNRVDPYQSFLAGDEYSKSGQPNVFSYGAGFKTWVGHIPNELSAYIGWGHTISDPVKNPDFTGGWYFSAKLDGMTSIGKEHTTIPGLGVRDPHDNYSQIVGSLGLAHNLTELSAIQFSLKYGLWGKNIGAPSSLHVGYSKVWRD